MISVCIPTFNYNITGLIIELVYQCKNETIQIEILVADDASTDLIIKQQNNFVKTLPNVELFELERNIGRAAIRNLLAEKATNENLIFIDADSALNHDFLKKYISCLPTQLAIGGTTYQTSPPDNEFYLRWHYGCKREKKDASIRSKAPYKSFAANNFLIKKELFLSIRFDENIKEYGHEDTIFGYEIKKRQIDVVHINNPVFHIGLEPAEVFIAKTLLAIENLLLLYNKHNTDADFIVDNQLLKVYEKISKNILRKPITKILSWLKPYFNRQLLSPTPKLLYFDLLKLAHILELSQR